MRVVLVLLLACAAAQAQGTSGKAAFDAGRELARKGRFAEACEKFRESFTLDPAPGTALNYGDCLEKLGKGGAAWAMYDEAARAFEKLRDPRATFARERARAVEAKLALVVVQVREPATPELVVRIGDETVTPAPEITLRLPPGELALAATAPGREPYAGTARGVAGERVVVEIPALAVVAPPPPPPPPPRAEPARRDPGRLRLAFGVAGAGGAALLGSLALGLVARSQYHSAVVEECATSPMLVCSDDGLARIDASFTKADIATGLAIGGGVLVAAGVVLYVTAPRTPATITPTASASAVSLAVSGRF